MCIKKIGKKSIKDLFNKLSNNQFESEDLFVYITDEQNNILFKGGKAIFRDMEGTVLLAGKCNIVKDDVKGPHGFIKFILKNE